MKIMALLVCSLKKRKINVILCSGHYSILHIKRKFIIAPTETVVTLCT